MFHHNNVTDKWAGIPQSVYGLDGRISVGARYSAPILNGLGAHAASCKMGTGSLSRVFSGRALVLTTQLV